MTNILVKNGLILTMDKERRVLENSVLIQGSEIKEVGDVDGGDVDKVIDAENKVVMPGLACAHTRPYRLLLSSTSLGVESLSDFTQVLQRVWWPLAENLTNKDIYLITLVACLEFIKSGTTLFATTQTAQGSLGKSLDYVAKAVDESHLRGFIGFEASERNTRAEGARGMRENIRFLEKSTKSNSEMSRVRGMACVESSFTASNELLRHGKRVASRFDAPLLISASEGKIDLYHNLEKHQKRTIERLRDVGFLSSNTVLSNCGNLSDEEISIIERSGSKVVHNPLSNMINGVEASDVLKMRERGISVGLGNGGKIFDGFENLATSYRLRNFMSKEPNAISPAEVLEMATIEGAKLFDMEDKVGSIEPGKRADLIILDTSDLVMPITRNNVFDQLVNNVRRKDVEAVMVDGELLMENRNIKTLDNKRIRRKFGETAKKVWKKLGHNVR